MKRRTHANPMRLLIMLAVMWAAGSLLFAAESSPPARTKPATQAQPAATPETGSAAATEPDSEVADKEAAAASEDLPEDPKEDSKTASQGEPRSKDKEESASEKAKSGQSESAADAGSSPRRFVPSEQVRADFDVSFPIDI